MEDKGRNLLLLGALGVVAWLIYKKGVVGATIPPTTTAEEWWEEWTEKIRKEIPPTFQLTTQPATTPPTTTEQPAPQPEETQEAQIDIQLSPDIAGFNRTIPVIAHNYGIKIIEVRYITISGVPRKCSYYIQVEGEKDKLEKFFDEIGKLKGYTISKRKTLPIPPAFVHMRRKKTYLPYGLEKRFTAEPVFAPKPHFSMGYETKLR